ncbi:hypothetical protein CAFE_30450 [Caprobacter fermentans]|uniref:Antitoxin SocA-like Panacea domain-containing protein n=1 Tax=Caproicibacter fermentans TaxID=2576756 RepID=A0A6N8I2T3_9FIRM|nr:MULTISPECIES: hypothetical protein [Acutalibacteraceae]MVB12312.1 hypothetical protein [Caproicibacter fermentans]QAT50238.1 hypothetical protein EQM14_10940 [Caproiciproducens sp. NJN-50]
MSKLIGSDYLLLLLYLDNKKPIKGAIRLTKMMFLFNEEIAPLLKKKGLNSDKLPEFFAYNYGPFSKELYDQIEFFRGLGFIKVTDINASEEMGEVDDWQEDAFIDEMTEQSQSHVREDGKYMKYEIATQGIKYVEEEILPLDPDQLSILEIFKKKIISLYPKQILKYVYTKYPKYTTNSLIKDEVMRDD